MMAEYPILDRVHSHADLNALTEQEIEALSSEIRAMLVDVVVENGGHLASNLGVVELTIAMHRVFETPRDHFIFEVGHQSSVHK